MVGSGLAVVGAMVLAVTLGSAFAGWPLGGSESAAGPPSPAAPAGPDRPELVRYHDPQDRFSLGYPQGWQQMASPDPQVALLVRPGPTSQNSLQVRILPLPEPVDAAQLDSVEEITDGIVEDSEARRVFVEHRITVDGHPTLYYLYTFGGRPGSDRFGIHARYFVVSGSTLYALAFQALPDTDFVELAPTFDRIARTFRLPSG
jgi:hypothetical protein